MLLDSPLWIEVVPDEVRHAAARQRTAETDLLSPAERTRRWSPKARRCAPWNVPWPWAGPAERRDVRNIGTR